MFGFGKKDKQKDNDTPGQAMPFDGISDDKFIVMPKQFLTQAGASSLDVAGKSANGSSRKFFLLSGAALIVLLAFSSVLYFAFFSKNAPAPKAGEAQTAVQTRPTAPPAVSVQEDGDGATKEKIINSQTYGETNVLIGSLEITIPATVVQEYGSGIGVTVLEKNDLTLPDDGTVIGGLYSAYPSGVSLDEPLYIEIIALDVPQAAKQADVYPAYLRGVKWQEFEDYQAPDSVGRFILSLEKLPTGPIAVIWNPEEEDDDKGVFEFTAAKPGPDADGDGLTDMEEQLFGTSASAADSDTDGFLDLEEIINGYSPSAGNGARLADDGIFATYTNATYGYRVSYPAAWLADSLDQTNKQVLFISETEEFFEILIEENPLNTPIVDWYRGQSQSLANVELDITAIDGRSAVWSPDGLTLYASKDGLIYVLTYNRGTRDEISWPNTFEYFYKNFAFGNTSTAANPPLGETGTTTADVL